MHIFNITDKKKDENTLLYEHKFNEIVHISCKVENQENCYDHFGGGGFKVELEMEKETIYMIKNENIIRTETYRESITHGYINSEYVVNIYHWDNNVTPDIWLHKRIYAGNPDHMGKICISRVSKELFYCVNKRHYCDGGYDYLDSGNRGTINYISYGLKYGKTRQFKFDGRIVDYWTFDCACNSKYNAF